MSKDLDDAFAAWETAVDDLDELAGLQKKAVAAVKKVHGKSKWRATQATERIREAIAEALGSETRRAKSYAALTDQGDLFKADGAAPPPPPPPSKSKGAAAKGPSLVGTPGGRGAPIS